MSYASLIERWQTWLEDDDTEFTGSTDDILALAEARVAKELNCDAMRAIVSGTITSGTNTIPRDAAVIAVRWIEITLAGGGRKMLKFRQDSWIRDRYPGGTANTGVVDLYGIQDEEFFVVGPAAAADTDYEMSTEQRVVGLNATTPTWLSQRHDDLLFYAGLLESGAFQQDSDQEKRYMAFYERALSTAKDEIVRGRLDSLSVNR